MFSGISQCLGEIRTCHFPNVCLENYFYAILPGKKFCQLLDLRSSYSSDQKVKAKAIPVTGRGSP
jgi:hypothetical protein